MQTKLIVEEDVLDQEIRIVKVTEGLRRLQLCPDCNSRIEPIWDDNDRMSRSCSCGFEEIEQ